jgi:signal transduction histidine kinase
MGNSHKILPHLYETVAREATVGILLFDQTGQCLFINKTGANQLGKATPKLMNLLPKSEKSGSKMFSPDILDVEGMYTDILLKKSKGTFVANIGVKHLKVDGHFAYLLMIEDMTVQRGLKLEVQEKQSEINAAFEELVEQNRRLIDLDRAKNRFMALTTHELRTPLSAMVASAEILKLGLYDTPKQMQEFVDMIYDQGVHLQTLVNDILDLAKIEAGKMEYFIEQRDVADVARLSLRGFEGMAENNKVTLIFVDSDEPMKCYFDEVRLRQVLSNMINNAIKYNRPHGTVSVYFTEDEDVVKVLVQDTGIGIAKNQTYKVFNEFETIGQFSEHHRGTGLGMPISRKLAEGMGGNLFFESEPGSGSTFWVEIPKNKVLDKSFYQSRNAKTEFAA